MTAQPKFIFRRAEKSDMKIVGEMIQELADFEKMSDGPQLKEKDLIRDSGLDGGKDYCHIYILEMQQAAHETPLTIGYSICYFAYSTWQGKSYFLEDFYVRPDYRKLGAGAFFFRSVAAKALEYQCKRLDFHVLAWNPAREFYKKMGATNLTETEDWHYYRVNEQQIAKLANEAKKMQT